jgi:ribonuclease-3
MQTRLNNKNVLITSQDINNILSRSGLNVICKNTKLYVQAFVHKSYVQSSTPIVNFNKNCVQLQNDSQEKMEFVGDSVLSFVICNYIHKRFRNFNEGQLTKLKQRIVDSKTLAKFARYYNFDKWCIISSFMENTTGRNQDKLMEDTFEAFLYALYLDLGMGITEKFILNTVEILIDFDVLLHVDINHKHQLLEHFQRFWNLTPSYSKISEIGMPYKKSYTVAAQDLFGHNLGTGTASIKKDSEQIASLNAIPTLTSIIELSKNPQKLIKFNDFEITEIVDVFKPCIGAVPTEDLDIILNVISGIKVFIIKFSIGKKPYNYIIRYNSDNYIQMKDLLNNPEKCLNYLRGYHTFVLRNVR